MGRGGVAPRLASMAAAGLFTVVAGWAGVAQAALSDSLCNPYAAANLRAYPTGDALRRAAAATETRLARRGAADPFQDLIPALDPPASGAAAPSVSDTAEYCSAAGELMRVSPEGSQLQAQSYLLSAFRMARAAGLGDTASVATYRLGLVSLSGSTAAGTRGARRVSRGGPADRRFRRLAPPRRATVGPAICC